MANKLLRAMLIDTVYGMKPGHVYHVSLSEVREAWACEEDSEPTGIEVVDDPLKRFAFVCGTHFNVALAPANSNVVRVERIK